MYYFVYHINTIALYCQEKPTSLMNENESTNPQITIKKCVGANCQDGKRRYFSFTKFSFIEFVLTNRRSLSGKRPKLACGKSSSSQFSLSAERNANTKATEYITFGFFLLLVTLRG